MVASFYRLAGLLGLALGMPGCSHLPARPDAAAAPLEASQPQTGQVTANSSEVVSGADDISQTSQDRPDHLIVSDLGNFWDLPNLGRVALGIGAAAPLANTTADQHFRDWYQRRIHGEALDGFAEVFKYSGQLWLIAPVGMEIAGALGMAGDDYHRDGGLFEWGNRSLRASAVGYPVVLGVGALLGAERPDWHDSNWRPFNDFHGVSGHTFIGAVPFLTATAMTDDWRWKTALVLGSFLTGWSRIHDDRHYLSQVALGWWMAALSVMSVSETQASAPWTVMPTVSPEGAGVAVQLCY